jgi:hypothetical protein
VINTQISNTQCPYRNTDYWADEGIIRTVVSVSVLTLCIRYLRVYHWVDTSAGRLLVSEGNTDYWADDALGSIVYQLRYRHSDKHVDIKYTVTSAGRLLVSEGIIRPVVSVSVLTLCIRYLRVETLTTGRMMPSETNSLPAEVSTQ